MPPSYHRDVEIAEVAATAFDMGLVSKEYNLTGPEALDHNSVAAILSKASGRTVTYQPIPEEAMLKGLRDTGMPEGAVQYVGMLYSVVRAGYAAAVTQDVQAVLGRAPTRFEDFARRMAAAFTL